MVKREFAANPDIDVDAPRSKRRKDVSAEAPSVDDVDMPDHGASSDQEQEEGATPEGPAMSPEEVRENGLKAWQVLKDAVDKEGRSISYDFLRLPSKRQFVDYYQIIKRPIALDDIKAQIESHSYASIEALRQDFEQCFKNAKKYNIRESIIWKDAKTLQKLANKEIEKIRRRFDEDEGDGNGSDKEGGKKKEKGVNINRLMKNRLQKLTSKTDDIGRLLAADFMDLPSRKKWAVYYKIIKKPICFEDIFKRIKRKEYSTIPDFMNDVDLVFANAMQFNEERSPIWEDAVTLKGHFRQLMTDLPAKYNMNGAADGDPSASPEVVPKIMLKLPHHQAAAQLQGGSTEVPQNGDTARATDGSVRLRVPALGGGSGGSAIPTGEDKTGNMAANSVNGASAKKVKTKSPAASASALPSSSSSPALAMPTPKLARAAVPAHVKSQQTAQHSSFTATPATPPYQHYGANVQAAPHNFYAPPPLAPASAPTTSRDSATPAPLSTIGGGAVVGLSGRTDAPTPAPPARAAGLYSVRLETYPTGRRLALLNAAAGVRSWAVRLGADEKGLVVRDVRFARGRDGEGEGSDEDHEGGDGDAKAEAPKKKRGRGRPRKVVVENDAVEPPTKTASSSSPKQKGTQKAKSTVPAVENVLVRLDGLAIAPKSASKATAESESGHSEASAGADEDGDAKVDDGSTTVKSTAAQGEREWAVNVAAGRHVLEVGRKGNSVLWQVYVYV